MDSIRINTGEKRISINDDPTRVIVFNPSDVVFAETFYALVGEFDTKLSEYKLRSEIMDADATLDANGMPANLDKRLALLREACTYMRSKIDSIFGKGTSQTAFGDTLSLDVFPQFFDGITPFIQAVREEKIAQYSGKKSRVLKSTS